MQTNYKQLKIIDKTKQEVLSSEPNQEMLRNIKKLQNYASNYLSRINSDSSLKEESFSESNDSNDVFNNIDGSQDNLSSGVDSQQLSQPEVESLMPTVR